MPSKTARRGAGSGALFQDSRGLWTAVIELPARDGRRRRKVIRRSKRADAVAALRDLRKELDRTGDLPTASPALVTWLTLWLDTVARPRLKPRTLATYRGYVDRNIVPVLGKVPLDKLTPAHIRRLHVDMADRGLSSTTALQAHRILAKALTDAEREGRVTRNVATLVDAPRKAAAVRPSLTADEARALLTFVRDDPNLAPQWGVALLAGLRQGERLGITREMVDLDAGILTVAWQLQRLRWEHGCGSAPGGWSCGRTRGGACPSRHVPIPADQEARRVHGGLWLTRPKSRAGWRQVPLAAPLLNVLRAHVEKVTPGDEGLIFTHGGHPIDPRDDSAAWDATLCAAGLPDVPLHSARHTANTLLHALGIDPERRQKIMGHSSAVVNAGYVHVSDAMTREAMDALGELLTPRRIEAP